MPALQILVVDDEPALRQILGTHLRKAGHSVEEAADGSSALELLARGDTEICLCDIRLPDIDGIEVLRRTKAAGVSTTFLMMTAYASVSTAIEAMKEGAYDYLMKPLRREDVLHRVSNIGEVVGLQEENRRLRNLVGQEERWISGSIAMQEVERLVAKVAPTDGTVLISGESGTGKSFVARRIHGLSPRADRPFIDVNCGAIPENLLESEFFGHLKGAFTGADHAKKGLFQEADGGTIFLDEIAELPLLLQVKLLHVLESKEVRPVGAERSRQVDVRILSATNRNIVKMVGDGHFREDLYYRLNVLQLVLPPLRERADELSELIRFFLGREADRLGMNRRFEIDPEAEDLLLRYSWPGNLRELQNVIARAVVLVDGNVITLADLPVLAQSRRPEDSIGGASLRERVNRFEASQIRMVVEEANGDRQVAAKRLGIGLSTLYRKLEESEDRVPQEVER